MATTPPKPVKITGSASGSKAATNFKNTQKIGMTATRTSAGVNTGSQGAKNINPLYAAVKSVTNYVGNVAREVRDIPTAVGTSIREKAPNELKKQVDEAVFAVKTGKKGTSSFVVKPGGHHTPNIHRQ
jgi:hypothetical protein